MTDEQAAELESFQKIHIALSNLDESAQERVLLSVSTLLGIGSKTVVTPKLGESNIIESELNGEAAEVQNEIGEEAYTEFAELYAATDPSSQADKALVAGYWLQISRDAENFTGQSVNNELNHLGHKISNITTAMTALNDTKPQLVLQLRKSGKSQQARKTYKLSNEGIKRVKNMIHAT